LLLILTCGCGRAAELNTKNIAVIPSPGNYIFSSDNKSSEIFLLDVSIEKGYAEESYSGLNFEVNNGEPILIVNGTLRNDHSNHNEIGMYADGYDENGNIVSETLDATYLVGAVGAHIEPGETGEFTLHMNVSPDIKSIRIFAGTAAEPMP